jgi:REP element-mobilizing transposase RayT
LLYKILRAMSDKYKIWDKGKAYFLTMTVVGWIDVFTRSNHKKIITNSLSYCQKNKGLVIFGYCLMPSHLHLIARAENFNTLSDILRDFKKFTSKAIIQQILNEPESRRDWMIQYFKKAGENLKGISNYKFWQDGNHAEMISSNNFFDEKLDYIHNNPVNNLIVERPEDYIFSSARNYAGLDNYLDIVLESVKQNTYR